MQSFIFWYVIFLPENLQLLWDETMFSVTDGSRKVILKFLADDPLIRCM